MFYLLVLFCLTWTLILVSFVYNLKQETGHIYRRWHLLPQYYHHGHLFILRRRSWRHYLFTQKIIFHLFRIILAGGGASTRLSFLLTQIAIFLSLLDIQFLLRFFLGKYVFKVRNLLKFWSSCNWHSSYICLFYFWMNWACQHFHDFFFILSREITNKNSRILKILQWPLWTTPVSFSAQIWNLGLNWQKRG